MTDDRMHEVEEPITIHRHEEVLEPVQTPVERGVVRVQRRVETVPSEIMAEVGHDEVMVERVEIGEFIESAPQPRKDGETWIIPVVEEQLVVSKRLVLKEEIRLTRRRVTESVPISDTVQRQTVEIETESNNGEKRSIDLRDQ